MRDEDVPTVASAITAMALQRGLLPIGEDEPQDLMSIAAMLMGPRVVLGAGEDFVVASGLESLEIGSTDEIAEALSRACETEVVAIIPTGDGIRVVVFADGDREEDVPVDLGASGKTTSPELAEIAPTEEAAQELASGVSAMNAVELAERVLQLFGGPLESFATEPTTLAFRGDPSL